MKKWEDEYLNEERIGQARKERNLDRALELARARKPNNSGDEEEGGTDMDAQDIIDAAQLFEVFVDGE